MQAKTKKLIITSSILGAIAVLAAVMIIRSKRKKLEASIAAGSPEILEASNSAKINLASMSTTLFPLKKGSGVTATEKDAVRLVQRYINARSQLQWWLQVVPLAEDGIFGNLTESALYKLAGVKEVSWSLYKEMQNYLAPAPSLLSPDTKPYQSL